MDFLFLSRTTLFRGTSPEEAASMLQCLGGMERSYEKEAVIYHVGDRVRRMGLVLSGGVNIESDDLWGNRSILSHVPPGELFAETYACIPDEPLMVRVTAALPSAVLLLDVSRLLSVCPSGCPHHSRVIQNLLEATAQKNLRLSQRILHTAPKTIRGRLTAYLADQAARQGSLRVTIPFNRQQLADYLGVDRSALSSELGRMRQEGLLETRKNVFHLSAPENGGFPQG